MMVDDDTKATASSNPFDECEDIFGLLKAGSEPRETQFLSWARTAPNASTGTGTAPPLQPPSAKRARTPTPQPQPQSQQSQQQQSVKQESGEKKEDGTTEGATKAPSREMPPARAKGCVHEVAVPEGWTPAREEREEDALGTLEHPRAPAERARTWPFVLDPFQETSVACIERHESVLVSAHTSAGKTVVAEYAIALALRRGQRVIYTSPIKALSNQKFRELKEEFGDVGLMTGDTTISPDATCLVMTTEILRSMLYRGSRVVREVAWVVFDEIHYLRNKERGVVWEETIIMLPDTVRMVFLSATIPNALEFAQWIAQTHRQPCHVVYTDMRPVPLQHYIFPALGDGLHLVVDENGAFCNDNFQKALASLTPENMRILAAQRGGGAGGASNNSKKKGGRNSSVGPDCERIVKMLLERHYNPLIVFAFSKREVEALALQMGRLDLLSDAEKGLVGQIFRNALASLSAADRQLPQIVNLLPLLLRGIAIHHSGLLPLLKEVIELLFQEGLVKVLFATETFSMGLNMPARTVVFTSVRKFDGASFRNVTPGEYIQMSGRAGRRGLDDRGIVVLMVDDRLEPADIKNMVWGESDPLNSAFYVSYSMLLNLLRVDMQGAAACDPDSLVARSFRQFQARRALPLLQRRLAALDAQRAALVVPHEPAVAEYYYAREAAAQLRAQLRAAARQPARTLPFLQPGRLVHIVDRSQLALSAFASEISKGLLPTFDREEVVYTDSDGGISVGSSASASATPTRIAAEGGVPIHGVDWGWGVVLGYEQRLVPEHGVTVAAGLAGTGTQAPARGEPSQMLATTYVVEVCIECADGSGASSSTGTGASTSAPATATAGGALRPLPIADRAVRAGPVELRGHGQVVMVTLDAIDTISAVRLNVPKDIRRQAVRDDVAKTVREVFKRFAPDGASNSSIASKSTAGKNSTAGDEKKKNSNNASNNEGGIPILDPTTDMGIEDAGFRGLQRELEALEDALHADARFRDAGVRAACGVLERRLALDAAARDLRHDVHEASREVVLASELHNMKRVLRRLGYISAEDVIETKGRVGAELTAGDELVLTELVFSGVFNEMAPERIAALVSCFVFEERVKGSGQEQLPPQRELVEAYRQVQETARRVATVWQECKIDCNVDEYVSRFNPTIMEVILAWCSGATFADVLKMSDLFEGSLIRMMRRLEELLKELSKAAKAIGNAELESRFAEAVTKLHKDVVFAASLYL